ncbi:Dihem cytochrome c [Mariprofundus ferrinatatus]|uniref:Dihem cytochrome c n=1 Tax=Mariprofundus ferrinatatus TaxID=1921087 RepID=A0A2K8LB75_9PROT|nr:diheme cytochrome c [Mariprofundus ferrinatatus]ATX82184.1 Dihem cytochrome c [Mariprofundus ferrinatatus]
MNKKIATGTAVMAICISLSVSFVAAGDDDWWGDKDRGYGERSATVAAVMNKTYETECGACHFAYQPGFLPVRSWVKMMGNLEDHFGDNATLDAVTSKEILDYLSNNAADRKNQRFSRSILRSIPQETTPLRITETRFFTGEHHELPKRLVRDNPKVRSFSNCQSCHTQAAKGDFNEHRVVVPGFGRWDD